MRGSQRGQPAPQPRALAVALGEALLNLAALLVRLGELRLDGVALLAGLGGARLGLLKHPLLGAEVARDQPRPVLERLALEPRVRLGGLRLRLQRPQVAARLALDVEHAREVVARSLELELRAAAALAVLAEPGGLLDE